MSNLTDRVEQLEDVSIDTERRLSSCIVRIDKLEKENRKLRYGVDKAFTYLRCLRTLADPTILSRDHATFEEYLNFEMEKFERQFKIDMEK